MLADGGVKLRGEERGDAGDPGIGRLGDDEVVEGERERHDQPGEHGRPQLRQHDVPERLPRAGAEVAEEELSARIAGGGVDLAVDAQGDVIVGAEDRDGSVGAVCEEDSVVGGGDVLQIEQALIGIAVEDGGEGEEARVVEEARSGHKDCQRD